MTNRFKTFYTVFIINLIPYFKNKKRQQKGFAPLIVLVIVGVVALATGASIYLKKQLSKNRPSTSLKTDKSSQTLPSQQLKEQEEENVISTPKLESNKYVFEAAPSLELQEQELKEPSFTINPPADWTQVSDPELKVLFSSPQQDKEILSSTKGYASPARLGVRLIPLENIPNYDKVTQQADYSDNKFLSLIDNVSITDVGNAVMINDELTNLGGQETRLLEYNASFTTPSGFEVWEHTYSYIFVKNRYLVIVSGASLDSAWNKRVATIKASLNTFAFIQ